MPVLLHNRQRAVIINLPRLCRTAYAILAAARTGDAELSVVLVSDGRMRALNARYRQKNKPTDVLAFPQLERCSAETSQLRRPQALASITRMKRGQIYFPRRKINLSPFLHVPVLLGDVVISLPTARRQAAEQGHGLFDEVVRLLIHGVLHLLGYDHERGPREAARMTRRERAILRMIH